MDDQTTKFLGTSIGIVDSKFGVYSDPVRLAGVDDIAARSLQAVLIHFVDDTTWGSAFEEDAVLVLPFTLRILTMG